MSNRYLIFLLGIVLVSVAFNFIQYEKTQDLQQSIAEYKKQNINNEYISKTIQPTPVSNPGNQSSVKIIPLPNANDTNFLSISAVAVGQYFKATDFLKLPRMWEQY